MYRRAALLALACGPFLALAAAERPRRRLGILYPGDAQEIREFFAEVMKSLAERGYVEGRQLESVARAIGGSGRALDDLAREIVASRPDVILTQGTGATAAAQRATRTIPIVTSVADPVVAGFAKSRARPGGNITGLSQSAEEVAVKTVDMTKLFIPRLVRVGILYEDQPGTRFFIRYYEMAARQAGLEPVMVPCKDGQDAIRLLHQLPAKGVRAAYWFGPGDMAQVAREAIRARIAMIARTEKDVELGMLASLEADNSSGPRQTAAIIDEIFAGGNPAEIPIQYPDRFRFVLNRRTATALGIAVTPELLLRADRVIE